MGTAIAFRPLSTKMYIVRIRPRLTLGCAGAGTAGGRNGPVPPKTLRSHSNDWHDFRAKLDRLHPPYGKPTQLYYGFVDDEPDTGKGL